MNPTPATGSLRSDSGQVKVPEASPAYPVKKSSRVGKELHSRPPTDCAHASPFDLSYKHALHSMKPKHFLETACLLRRSANLFQPRVCCSLGAGVDRLR